MRYRVLKAIVALLALGVLAAPLPSSDIGSCTVTELEPADPQQFCADLRLVQDRLARVCGLDRLSEEERTCENFQFALENPPAHCEDADPLPRECVCIPTKRAADHCLDVLFELESDECGGATDVREVDVKECGPCPGER